MFSANVRLPLDWSFNSRQQISLSAVKIDVLIDTWLKIKQKTCCVFSVTSSESAGPRDDLVPTSDQDSGTESGFWGVTLKFSVSCTRHHCLDVNNFLIDIFTFFFFFFLQHPDFPILWKIWVNYLVQWILILVLILVLIQMWIGILDQDHFLGWTRLKKCSTDFDLDTNALTQLGSYIQAETVLLLHSVDMYSLDHLGG